MQRKKSTNNVHKIHLELSATNLIELQKVENEAKELWRAFGQWLQSVRESAHKTQEDVSRQARVHVKTLSRIENGEPTRRVTVIKLAEAVGANRIEALNRAGFDTPRESSQKIATAKDFAEFLSRYGIVDFRLTESDLKKMETTGFDELIDYLRAFYFVKINKYDARDTQISSQSKGNIEMKD